MPIPPTPKPMYPDVPQAPGVPPVLRAAASVQTTVVALINDAQAVLQFFQAPQWGIFTAGGQPILAPPSAFGQIVQSVEATAANLGSLFGLNFGQPGISVSVVDFEYRRTYRIATAPQEQGAFTSYNKVQLPFDARMTFAVKGTQAQRSAFFTEIEALAASLDLLAIVTPEITYTSANIINHNYRREGRSGVSMVLVDVWLEEVRVTGTAQFSTGNTGGPSGADSSNTGSVTPLNPAQNANLQQGSGQPPQTVPPAGGLT